MHGRTPPRARRSGPAPEQPIGPAALWRGSMMAHSAVDPYWRAKVRFESANTPAAAAVIEDKCLSCHAPMQQYNARATGKQLRFNELAGAGLEGVSCTVCHQITPDRLGEKASFSAGFTRGADAKIYGPHADPFPMPMRHHTPYAPAESAHILESSLCASCHTVITPTLDEDGNVLGEFVEQAPYLEWLASSYPASGKTCQSCHMPVLEDSAGEPVNQYIAHNPAGFPFPPTRPRNPFGQHVFVGGNTQILGMLRDVYPDESAALALTQSQTLRNLRSALTVVPRASIADGQLQVDVKLINHAGHKLPSAYPSRRMWIYLSVTDSDGQLVFESGAFDRATGELLALAGRHEPVPFEPHRALITHPEQVAVYEAEMATPDGQPTVSLMRANGYAKDNRILPRGFDLSRPQPNGIDPQSIRPVGVESDPDFLPGSDTVRYAIATGDTVGPFHIELNVYFQSVKPSHLGGMAHGRSSEERAFLDSYPRHSQPSLIGEARLKVGR